MKAISESGIPSCHREACIARARNVVLNRYYKEDEYKGFNYLMLIDCDFDHNAFQSDAVLTSFLRDDWSISCANG